MKDSNIGWTNHTHNFWFGCDKVSAECDNCYLMWSLYFLMSGGKNPKRYPFTGARYVRKGKAFYADPVKWNKQAEKSGERPLIFTCSLSDFFHKDADQWRAAAWKVIKDTPHLTWQILTKRANLIEDRLPADWGEGYENVWLGVTAGVNKSRWRIRNLQEIPAKIKFISAEPLLEELDLRDYLEGIHWVISGCESIHSGKASNRVMDLNWVRDLDIQCYNADVPHFLKQYADKNGRLIHDSMLDGHLTANYPE